MRPTPLSVLVLGLLVACGEGDDGDLRNIPNLACTSDERRCEVNTTVDVENYFSGPGEHRTSYCPKKKEEGKCWSSLTCPSGTECDRGPDKVRQGTCKVPEWDLTDMDNDGKDGRPGRQDVLWRNFGFDHATRFEGNAAADNNGKFLKWSAPIGSKHVVCALFVCEPVFGETGRRGPHIRNYERCVVSRKLSSNGQLGWNVRESLGDPVFEDHLRSKHCHCAEYTRPVRLTRGCWSTDEYHTTAASPMLLLNHEDIFELGLREMIPGDAWVANCDDPLDEDKSCHNPDAEDWFFGACRSGECLKLEMGEDTECIE